MRKIFISIFLFFLIFLADAQGALKKGDPAPDFSITGVDGKAINLYDLKSKVILIEFLSIKCFTCDMVIPDLNRLRENFSESDLLIIGVFFTDEVENLKKLSDFSKDRGIKYPVYFADVKIKKVYNVYGFPNFFILNEKKHIVQSFRGITRDTYGLLKGEIEKIFNKGSK